MGYYRFPGPVVGRHIVTAIDAGFKTQVIQDINYKLFGCSF